MLAATHSPAKAGLVAFARLVPHAVFGLLAGVAVDRWNRKRLMIAADAVRAVAIASLVATILLDRLAFWQISVVAFVEGTGSVVFGAAQAGALRAVVPPRQLPAAVGAQEARSAAVGLVGPPFGGALFGLGRAVPFLVDAVSYTFSFLSLLAMRTPFQEQREVDKSRLRSQIAEGFRFLWSQPFLRTCAFLYGLGNFALPGVLLVIVVAGKRWTWIGSSLFLIWPSVYVLTAAILPQAVAMPVTDSVVIGYRVAVTPDRLLGRVESVRSSIALLVSPLGPLVAGFLLSSVSVRATVAVFTACGVVLALWGTLSPSIRNAPSLDELDGLGVGDSEPDRRGTQGVIS